MGAKTQVPFGSKLAAKVYGAAAFQEITRKQTFSNRLVGPAPTYAKEKSKAERMQTSKDYPCVRITDLTKNRGDTVSVDLFNILQGKPVMGDKKLSGKAMGIKSSSQDIKITQIRGAVDTGGNMAQQRTVHDLRNVGRANLSGWWARYLDQLRYVQ